MKSSADDIYKRHILVFFWSKPIWFLSTEIDLIAAILKPLFKQLLKKKNLKLQTINRGFERSCRIEPTFKTEENLHLSSPGIPDKLIVIRVQVHLPI